MWNQWFELQHRNFSGQAIEVTLILPFHKQARAQMRCKRSKWSSNFKWPKPNYVFASCFSISLKMKLTIKCLWTVSLGQLRELKNNIICCCIYILYLQRIKKEKSLYVGYEESFRDEVGFGRSWWKMAAGSLQFFFGTI